MSTTLGFTREQVIALSEQLGEPDWMRQFRLAAWDTFEALALPDRTDEDWRMTDVGRIKFADMAQLAVPNGKAGQVDLSPWLADTSGVLLFEDGALTEAQLDDDVAAQGVIFCSLSEAVREHPELVQRAFMTRCVEPGESKLTALHAALWNTGAFCYVPAGVTVERPFLSRVLLHHGGVSELHHTLVLVEARGQAAFIEEFTGGGEAPACSVPVSEIICEAGSQVEFSTVQTWGKSVYNLGVKRAWLEQDANLVLNLASLGSKVSKSFVGAVMNGQGSHVDLSGIYFPGPGQQVDFTTLQDHRVGGCHSDLLFKGAVRDRARSVFRGVVRVEPNAQATDAYQTNNNLLLGNDARADSMPVLEIEADDVRCSHGATLAHLDETDLFYLMSRGVPRAMAQRMVIAGFFEPVIDRISLAGVRDRLHDELRQRIEGDETA